MFTVDQFVAGQNIDLKNYLIDVTPVRTPFTTLLLGKTVKADSANFSWVEVSLNESSIKTIGEGADSPAHVLDSQELKSNYAELLAGVASVSNTAQYSKAVGISDLLLKDVEMKSKAMKLAIEDRLINGKKKYTSATKTYETGGILEQIHADNKVSNATFTEAKFIETIERLYNAGANGDMVVFLPAQMKLKLNDFKNFQFFAKDKMAGVDVDTYVTPFGNVRFTLTEKISNGLFIVNPSYLELGELIPFHAQVEPVSGSKQSIYLETQLGLKLLNSKAGASFTISA